MKTIEERAKEYANILGATLFMDSPEEDIIYRDDLARAYASAAKEERAELTRWHDPKEDRPEPNHIVLTKWKYKDGSGERISVGGFNGEEWDAHAIIVCPELFDIIGWREIHE